MSNILQYGRYIQFGTDDPVQTNSSSYAVWISSSRIYGAPGRDVTFVEIPGRSGDFVIDNGRWKDIEIVYECFINGDFKTRFRDFKAAMLQKAGTWQKLVDSEMSGQYRMAVWDGQIEPEVTGVNNRSATFELKFHCQPQKWSTLNEDGLTNPGSIVNATGYTARPVIVITGTGTLTVGSSTVTIANGSPFTSITVDSEAQDCYSGSANANAYVTLSGNEFPTLPVGTTTISASGSITQYVVFPRWYSI